MPSKQGGGILGVVKVTKVRSYETAWLLFRWDTVFSGPSVGVASNQYMVYQEGMADWQNSPARMEIVDKLESLLIELTKVSIFESTDFCPWSV